MDAFVVWYFLGTLMPHPSSHTFTNMGTCSTQAAFIVSQNGPSDVLASPMVPMATSRPPRVWRALMWAKPGISRHHFEACASPSRRGRSRW